MCRKEMDEYLGYFTVFPYNWKDKNASKDKPYLFISPDCPEDIKEKIQKKWEQVYKDTIERQKKGIYSSKDYFFSKFE